MAKPAHHDLFRHAAIADGTEIVSERMQMPMLEADLALRCSVFHSNGLGTSLIKVRRATSGLRIPFRGP